MFRLSVCCASNPNADPGLPALSCCVGLANDSVNMATNTAAPAMNKRFSASRWISALVGMIFEVIVFFLFDTVNTMDRHSQLGRNDSLGTRVRPLSGTRRSHFVGVLPNPSGNGPTDAPRRLFPTGTDGRDTARLRRVASLAMNFLCATLHRYIWDAVACNVSNVRQFAGIVTKRADQL